MKNLKYNTDTVPNLPKWPAFVVSGTPVTPKQAAEILIKTDRGLPNFKYRSNNRQLEDQLSGLFNFPLEDTDWELSAELTTKLKVLDLDYLVNDQIISSYIGGPHGWCDWNGNIFSNNTNIGKWPDVEEVAQEWAMIAEAFPFLNLTCHLFYGEVSEITDQEPVIEFIIKDGMVVVGLPSIPTAGPNGNIDELVICRLLTDPNHECGISVASLKQKLIDVYGSIPQYGE